MDTSHARKGKRQSSPIEENGLSPRQSTPLSSAGINPPALVGLYLSRSGMNREGRVVNFDKILKNSINTDKFTGFFDKKSAREIIVKHCNSTIINMNLSAGDSNMTGKFFQRAAFARRGRPAQAQRTAASRGRDRPRAVWRRLPISLILLAFW